MYEIDKSSPVLVTGANGYVASWIVKKLLEAGVTVHAGVRDASNEQKLQHLNEIARDSAGKIKYFDTDLLSEGSYAQAMNDCSVVFHTASPFTMKVNDPQMDLVDPAKLGTRNVLMQANETDSVRRVVVTSSCAAICGDSIDLLNIPGGVFTEDIWNTSSSLSHNPYSFSKVEAEREAWKIADAQNRWDLAVINPSLVMGPSLGEYSSSESANIIRQMGDGTMKMGAPNWEIGVVDVRDVAQAHIASAYLQEAKGRYIVSGTNSSFLDMATKLMPKFGGQYPLPRRTIPKFIIWLFFPIISRGMVTRKTISRNVDYKWKGDNSKSIKELGMSYRDLSETMNDFFCQMIERKQL